MVYVAVSSTVARVAWLCQYCFWPVLGRSPVWNLISDTDCRVVVVSCFHPEHPDECCDNSYVQSIGFRIHYSHNIRPFDFIQQSECLKAQLNKPQSANSACEKRSYYEHSFVCVSSQEIWSRRCVYFRALVMYLTLCLSFIFCVQPFSTEDTVLQ